MYLGNSAVGQAAPTCTSFTFAGFWLFFNYNRHYLHITSWYLSTYPNSPTLAQRRQSAASQPGNKLSSDAVIRCSRLPRVLPTPLRCLLSLRTVPNLRAVALGRADLARTSPNFSSPGIAIVTSFNTHSSQHKVFFFFCTRSHCW